jgi:molybdenum cofactor guanylyltransferase
MSETKICSAMILAGGASRRMGRDKAWVELDGVPLIERVLARVSQLTDDVVIVTNDFSRYEKMNARLTRDVIPNAGSLGGIYSGLLQSRYAHTIAVACDMPFLNVALLRYLAARAENFDVVIPSVADAEMPTAPIDKPRRAKDMSLHPLHAVYSKNCIGPMRDALERGDMRMVSFYDAVRVEIVRTAQVNQFDPEHFSILNVNTPEQLAHAEMILQTQREA